MCRECYADQPIPSTYIVEMKNSDNGIVVSRTASSQSLISHHLAMADLIPDHAFLDIGVLCGDQDAHMSLDNGTFCYDGTALSESDNTYASRVDFKEEKARKLRRMNPEVKRSRYGDMSDAEILALWERQHEQHEIEEKEMHARISRASVFAGDQDKEFGFYIASLLRRNIVCYQMGKLIGCPDPSIGAQIHFLGFDNRKYHLSLWKNQSTMERTGVRYCGAPLERYKMCDYVKYSLQLHIQNWILRKSLGIDVDPANMTIVLFSKDRSYQEVQALNLKKEANDMFDMWPMHYDL